MRRLSTYTFGQRAAGRLENGHKVVEALAFPQIVDILATLDGRRPLRAFILGAFQVFKSLAGQLHLARNKLVRPGPALWYAPSDDFGKEFADLKYNPLFDAQPALRALLYTAKSKRGKTRYSLAGGASLLILSANTENDRHGKTARDVYLDEVHGYESGWISQIRNRHGAYPDDYLELLMSTGLIAETEAHNEWLETDQRIWHMRCPACQRLIEPRFSHHGNTADPKAITGGLRYERKFLPNGMPDAAAIAATLVHECPHCHDRLPDTPASRLALNGTAAAPRGLYVITNAGAAPGVHGWNFHGLTVRPWLPMVLRFEKAQLARQRGDLDELGKCIREEFAGIWNPNHHLGEKVLRRPSGYRMLEDWTDEIRDPRGKPWRFCAVDVQQDHYVVVIRKWGRVGPSTRTRLHFCAKVTTPAEVELLANTYGVPPVRVLLDARHKPEFVRRLCARYGWRPVMGEPKVKSWPHPVYDARGLKVIGRLQRIYSEPIRLDPFLGQAEAGRVHVEEVHFSKSAALERLHILRTLDTNDGTPLWTDADDSPEWYRHEVDAFHRIAKRDAQNNTYYEWISSKEDHAADCECIAIIGASMGGLIGSESIEPAATEPAPAPAA